MLLKVHDRPATEASASVGTFASLKFRNFRLFFGGQLISQVGNWLTMIAQTLLVLKLTNSGIAIGVLAACQFAPVLIFGPWAGLIADRSDKRKLLMIVQTLAMLQSFALASLAFMHHTPLIPIFAVALFGGFTTAFDNPSRRAFVTEMVPDDHLNNAVSLNSALMTSSRIFGPALAGLLAATVGYGWCFTVDGLSYIAVILGLWLIRSNELKPVVAAVRAKGQVRAGLRYVRSIPDLWLPLAMMGVIGTLSFNFQVVIPLLVKRDYHGTDATFTLFFSIVSIGSLFGALLAARRKTIDVRSVAVSAIAFGIAMLVLAASPNLGFGVPAAILMGFASIWFMTASTAIVQIRSAPEMRGRVLALQAMLFLGSTPIGGPLLGWICQTFGARAGLVVGGVAAMAAATGGLVVVRRIGRFATPPVATA
ncbi:MAG: MFS transporter [Acidimicrobiales bacterium]